MKDVWRCAGSVSNIHILFFSFTFSRIPSEMLGINMISSLDVDN